MFEKYDKKSLEKYSSAVTLSDMEIFIFPEIMYSLVMANIMSGVIWEWKNDPWFDKIEKLNPYRKILRIKQYIMDKFVFNLDLDTWGLTTKEKEIARFKDFIDTDILSQSNALFGYEGDKYYFDIDIRRHFGLDKYDTDIIPYWKTETVEAMEAFKYKEGYRGGAGECVSLATLYAAALFVIGDIALEDIYLLGTPLHSQNFVMVNEGIITNNRRIVTKNMWFNGTEISFKARRAIQNEKITLVTNNTGYIHTVYDEMTIENEYYEKFSEKLKEFLKTEINYEILANFLRQNTELQRYFQFECNYFGKTRYIKAEDLYNYENSNPIKVGQVNQCELINSIDEDDFYANQISGRINLNKFEIFFKNNTVNLEKEEDMLKLKDLMCCTIIEADDILKKLIEFCKIEPKLPNLKNKKYIKTEKINIKPGMKRDEIIKYIESIRDKNIIADLAFYAYRDLSKTDWQPFIKAALERNPVSLEIFKNMEIQNVYQNINMFENESIYVEETRLAQPDEVVNYKRGDGFEKLFCLLSVLKNIEKDLKFNIYKSENNLILDTEKYGKFEFSTNKNIKIPEKEDFEY